MLEYEFLNFLRSSAHGAAERNNTAPELAASWIAWHKIVWVLPTDSLGDDWGSFAGIAVMETRKFDFTSRISTFASAHGLPRDKVDGVTYDTCAPRHNGICVSELLDAAATGNTVNVIPHGFHSVVGFDRACVVILIVVDADWNKDDKY